MDTVNLSLWNEYFTSRTRRVESGCLEWTLHLNTSGYGAIGVTWSQSTVAHRVSYELRCGRIPDGYDVHHKCRNRICVEPAHLSLIEHAEHCRDNGHNLKSHCPRGHEYSADNTRFRGSRRVCRTCTRERERDARAAGRHRPQPGACIDCGVETSGVRRVRCKTHAALLRVRSVNGRFS